MLSISIYYQMYEQIFRYLLSLHLFDEYCQPEDTEEPLTDGFRGLFLLNGIWWLVLEDPFIVVDIWGKCEWGDCPGVQGLGSDEDVDGAAAGLLALSLPESLSKSPLVLFTPSCWIPILILLHVCLTRYFRGSGPFWNKIEDISAKVKVQRWKFLRQLYVVDLPSSMCKYRQYP